MGECRQRQEAARRQRALEGSAAAAAGLAMVYSVPSLRMQHALTRFLERLAAEAAARGPVGGGGFRGVPLCVVPDQARVLEPPCWTAALVILGHDRPASVHAWR